MLRIDAQAQMHLYGFVELSKFDLLEKRNCLIEGIIARLYLLQRGLVLFSWFPCHISSLVQTAALPLAEPAFGRLLPRRAHLPLSPCGYSTIVTRTKIPAQARGSPAVRP